MKKVIFTAATVMLVALSSAYANPNYDDIIVKVQKSDAASFQLIMANLEKASTTVTIDDQTGANYFTNSVKDHNGFNKRINVEKLPDGKYIMTISQSKQKIIYVLVKNEGKLMFSKPVSK